MAKKKTKKVVPIKMAPAENKSSGSCCEGKWNLVPLRIALGLMFFVAGLIKLISLFGGSSPIPGFFASVGIPLATFSAWLVAIIEVLGGTFLMLGLFTWCTGLLLGIIMIVATIVTSLSPWNWGTLTQHLTFIAALLAVMYGSKYFSISKCCCCKCCKKE